jgi:tRNA 2-thiouridine synthesizing protein A
VVVDARGLRCPIPVIRAARAARDLRSGDLVEVLATDPAAGPDLAAWARMRGHHVEELDESGDVVRVVVRLG